MKTDDKRPGFGGKGKAHITLDKKVSIVVDYAFFGDPELQGAVSTAVKDATRARMAESRHTYRDNRGFLHVEESGTQELVDHIKTDILIAVEDIPGEIKVTVRLVEPEGELL